MKGHLRVQRFKTSANRHVKTESVQTGSAERLFWLVESPELADSLVLLISAELGPSVKVRLFCKPEMALEALGRNEGSPDILITAFYFDGSCNSGLWLVQEARKIHPNLRTVVTSAFPLEHLKGVAADWQVQPDLLLHKGVVGHWVPALKELLAHPSGAKRAPRRIQPGPAAFRAITAHKRGSEPAEQGRRRLKGRPLVYFVGTYNCLSVLKRCMGRSAHPPRFERGYDWEHFEDPETAWARLDVVREKPEALVTDYYLSGGYINGLKLVRHAQGAVPGIWTVLVSEFAEFHVQGIMDGTRISPDLSFHIES